MQAGSGSRLHPLVIAAAVSVIVLAAVGIAAFTGVLPSSRGSSAPAAASPASAPAAAPVASQAPAPKKKVAHHTARTEPTRVAATSPSASQPLAQSRPACADCGVIESVHEVDVKGQGTGLGAVAGGVAGAVLGNQVGGGNGRTVMTLVGAAGGALAGNQIEKNVRSTKHWDVSVRLENGTTRVISLATEPTWHAGDHVRIVNDSLVPN